ATLTGATRLSVARAGYVPDGTAGTLPVLAVPFFCRVAANALPDLRPVPLRAEALNAISPHGY
ncbi:hypothetical protein ACYCBP_11540, partial [Klebsiella pneumoniae]